LADRLELHDNSAGYGGALANAGTATLQNVRIYNNQAQQQGGGIFQEGHLTIDRSSIYSNAALGGSGGGILTLDGGAVRVELTNSAIYSNTTTEDGGGIGVRTAEVNMTATLTNTTISGNRAAGNGGGIAARTGFFTLNNVTIDNPFGFLNTLTIAGGTTLTVNGTLNLANAVYQGYAPTEVDALREIAPVLMGFKRGRRSFTRQAVQLHRPG